MVLAEVSLKLEDHVIEMFGRKLKLLQDILCHFLLLIINNYTPTN